MFSCFGESDGQIELTITGGTPGTNYNYAWSQDLPSNSIQNSLAPGNYRATVTDSRNCEIVSDVITINQPSQLLVSSISSTRITNGSNGRVNLSIIGGNPQYGYAWSGPNNYTANTNNLSGLSVPGEYCVTVTDANNCELIECIDVAARLSVVGQAITTACFGDNNGGIEITVSGGVPEYTYNWSNGANGPTLSNVAAGTYRVTIADGEGDEINASYEIPEYDEIGIVAQVTEVSINGNNADGGIQLTVNGGQTPYSYNWGDGQMTKDLANLSVGNYCVTVTDQRNCTSDICIDVIRQPVALSSTAQVVDVSCNGEANGEITINIVGGFPPYRLEFGDNEVIDNITENQFTKTDVAAGNMLYTLIDSRNTVVTNEVVIAEPMAMALTEIDLLHNKEGENCSGSISLTIAGGTPGYSVTWNSGQTGSQIINLCAREDGYIPTVMDATGCTKSFDAIELNTFAIQGDITSVECPMDNDGAIALTVEGGQAPYNYEWTDDDNNIISADPDLSELEPGSYTLRITEGSGNTISRVFLVEVASSLSLELLPISNFNGFAVSCKEATNGMVRAIGANGDGLTYEWTNSDGALVGMGETLSGVGPGTYTATVFDDLGCAVSAETVLEAPDAIEIEGLINDVSCPGNDDGEIIAEVTGGVQTLPFNYLWADGSTGQRLTFLNAGTYSVTATDGNGCIASATFEIAAPDSLRVSVETQPATERNGQDCNGAARAIVEGGTPPYRFDWKQQPGASESMIANLCPGEFIVAVTDDNGCTSSEFSGSVENRLFPCLEDRNVISPDGDGLNDTFVLFCSGDLVDNHLEIYNRWGQLVYEIDDYDCSAEGGLNCWEGQTQGGENLPEGAYYYVLEYTNVDGVLVQQRGSISLIRE